MIGLLSHFHSGL